MATATLDTKSLVNAIQWVTKSFDNKDSKASLTLSLSNDKDCFVSYGNQTSYMKAPLSIINLEEDLELSLDGRYMQRLSGILSSGEIELKQNSSGSLQLKSTAGEFTVPTFNSKPAKQPNMTNVGTIDEKDYLDFLQRLSKICDMVSAGLYPFLGTVDVSPSVKDKKITLMSTDRYALGEVVLDFSPTKDSKDVFDDDTHLLVPFESASLINPSKTSGIMDLLYDKETRKFGYSFSDGRIALFSLKDASRLKYKTLKENSKDNTDNYFTVKAKEFQKAISDISKLDWGSEEILLEVSEDKIIVSDVNKTNKLEVPADNIEIDEDISIKFVKAIIDKIFVPVSTEKIRVLWKNESNPFIVQPILDNGSVLENVFILTIPVV